MNLTRTHARSQACTYARMHARTHTHTHTWMHARTHTHMEARTNAHARTRTHACTPSRMHARMHARTNACTHACTHASMHVCTHARMHAYTHARTHARTHACTHARTHALHTCTLHTRAGLQAMVVGAGRTRRSCTVQRRRRSKSPRQPCSWTPARHQSTCTWAVRAPELSRSSLPAYERTTNAPVAEIAQKQQPALGGSRPRPQPLKALPAPNTGAAHPLPFPPNHSVA